MNRAYFEAWKSARPGPAKERLLQKLLSSQEPLVQKCAQTLEKNSQYYLEPLREDLQQAARIGLLRAINQWEPDRGAFSTIAWNWMRHEMQQVVRHATPISRPKSADLPRKKQDAAAAFRAQHGREPTPAEIGVSETAVKRAEKAQAKFLPMNGFRFLKDDIAEDTFHDAQLEVAVEESPEETIDRKRDMKALEAFVRKLAPADRKDFLAGKRDDLTTQATEYVARRRGLRRVA